MAVYAVSDLHGQLDVFLKGLKEIEFSDRDELYVIGDAVDRGPAGIEILQYIKDHENLRIWRRIIKIYIYECKDMKGELEHGQ